MMDLIESELQERFDAALTRLKKEFTRIRTGRANVNLLDGVTVPYYGTPTPLTQVATVKIPEPRMITIAPWEKSMLGEIEKAIHTANLGVSPNNDGSIIRLSIPPLTGERREELARQARKIAEDARIGVRNARRDANEQVKAFQKDGEMTEDEMHRNLARVQALTDTATGQVDETLAEKEKEILEV